MTLLLADEVFLLCHYPSGVHRRDVITIGAGVVGGVLGELMLRERLLVGARAEDHALSVRSPVPTGEPILDDVLSQMHDGGPAPAYEMIDRLRPTVYDDETARLLALDILHPVPGRPDRVDAAVHRAAIGNQRPAAIEAIRTSSMDSRVGLLAVLAWAVELPPVLLGRSAVVARYRLKRHASRHWLAVAVRTAIGLHVEAPYVGSG